MLFVEQRRVGLISPDTDFVWDEDNPTFRISTNLRTIDPHALGDGRLRPPSAIDGEFACHRSDYLSSKRGKWPMRVIPYSAEEGDLGATQRPGICCGALVTSEFIRSNDDRAILAVISGGRADTSMEGFADKLTEEEMLLIAVLLRSWQ